jgi:Holliday junction resolvasome RuvABC endonuclease subunit
MSKRILALDIATTTGYAVDKPGGGDTPLSGSFRCSHFDNDVGDAYVEFEQHLVELIGVHKPDVLVFEAPLVLVGGDRSTVKTNQQTARKLFGLAAIAELIGARSHLRVFECDVSAVRSHFLGRARFHKNEVKQAVMRRCQQLGYSPNGYDAADGCAVWDYARHRLRVAGIAAFALTPAVP